MSPGPIRALRFIHHAIRAEYAALDHAVSGFTDARQAALIVEPLQLLTRLIRGHAKGEDLGYFPALAERAGTVTRSFTLDHADEQVRLDKLDEVVRLCANGDGTPEDLSLLRRSIVVEKALIDSHMAMEERLLWPLTEELFTPAEQGALLGAMVAVIPREEMPILVPWIMERQSDVDALEYVGVLEKAMPAPAFAGIMEAVKNGVSDGRWAIIRAARPDLA